MANSISGNAGVAGALVILGGAATATATADGAGAYLFAGLSAGKYYITCQLFNKVFTPYFSTQTLSGSDITGVNFTASAAPIPQANWYKQGIVLPPNTTQINGGTPLSGALEPTVIFEGNAKILSGNVFKMWFTGGASGTTTINYAESLDGVTWTQYSGNPLVSGHSAGRIFKNGATYHAYWGAGTNDITASIDHYTSSDGVNWTLANTAVLSVGAAGTWESTQIYGLCVAQIDANGTWWGLYSANNSNSILMTGVATSPDGATWTKYAGNPVLINFIDPYILKSGSTFYAWGDTTIYGQGGGTPNEFPTNFARTSSTDLINWTPPIPVLQRTDTWEGLGNNSQVDWPSLLEVSNKTYMWHGAAPTGALGTSFQIALAVANKRASDLVATTEGVLGFQQGLNIVQNVTVGTFVITLTNPVIAGNTIFLFDSNGSSTNVTDNQGNTYTKIGTVDANAINLWMCQNVLASGSLTITVTCPNASFISMTAAEYSTGQIINPKDNVVSKFQASGTNLTIGPIATSNSNELVIFFGTVFPPSGSGSIPTAPGFVTRVDGNNGTGGSNANIVQDSLVVTAGNTNFAATAVSNSFGAPMFLVSLKTSASGSGSSWLARERKFVNKR